MNSIAFKPNVIKTTLIIRYSQNTHDQICFISLGIFKSIANIFSSFSTLFVLLPACFFRPHHLKHKQRSKHLCVLFAFGWFCLLVLYLFACSLSKLQYATKSLTIRMRCKFSINKTLRKIKEKTKLSFIWFCSRKSATLTKRANEHKQIQRKTTHVIQSDARNLLKCFMKSLNACCCLTLFARRWFHFHFWVDAIVARWL